MNAMREPSSESSDCHGFVIVMDVARCFDAGSRDRVNTRNRPFRGQISSLSTQTIVRPSFEIWVIPQGVATRSRLPFAESTRNEATYDPRLGACPEIRI